MIRVRLVRSLDSLFIKKAQDALSTAEIALKILQHKSLLALARIVKIFEAEISESLFLNSLYFFVDKNDLEGLFNVL